MRALDRLHTRREDGDIRAWLFAIMHNSFVSQRRHATARRNAESLGSMRASVSAPGEQEAKLRWRDVMSGLGRLPADQRAVILLVSVEDLSCAEAARVLGIPVGTVMSRLARGREGLRRLTAEEIRPRLRGVK